MKPSFDLSPGFFFLYIIYCELFRHLLTQDMFWAPTALRFKFVTLTNKEMLKAPLLDQRLKGCILRRPLNSPRSLLFHLMCFILGSHSESSCGIAPTLRFICYSVFQKDIYNCAVNLEGSLGVCQNVKHRVTVWTSNSTSCSLLKRNENVSTKKNLYINVHSLIIQNRQKWKQPKCPSMMNR